MSSPLVYLDELTARKAELSSRIEMMENHLAGKDTQVVGSWRDTKDVTEQDVENLKAELAHIEKEIERVSSGTGRQS
jgi:predicted phage gp36 major capsid-like protein